MFSGGAAKQECEPCEEMETGPGKGTREFKGPGVETSSAQYKHGREDRVAARTICEEPERWVTFKGREKPR